MKPVVWSIKRELWENRSIYMAPMSIAGVILFAYCFTLVGLPERRRAALLLTDVKAHTAIGAIYDAAAVMLILTAFLAGAFYCADALFGERRDRSILFWKSLPVSDAATVVAKVIVALAVLPAITFLTVITVHAFMFELSGAVLITHGISPFTTLDHYNLFAQSLILLYGLIVLSLWYAPVYGWLLLVSCWTRRHPLVFAILPWVAIAIVERITTRTNFFRSMLRDRLIGFAPQAFDFKTAVHGEVPDVARLTPLRYFSTPSLWIGLLFAAICIAAAVRLRRNREPL